jgi:hypothetical protein
MHHDPQSMTVSTDFDITLKDPIGTRPHFNQNNKELDSHSGGTIWLANDGGIYASYSGGQTWILTSGFSTLLFKNLAGLNKQPSGYNTNLPALFSGLSDNDNFYTLDGG